MGQKYLIDSNVISHLFSGKLPEAGRAFVAEVINSDFVISVITEIEVLTHHENPEKLPLIEEFIGLAHIIPLESKITRKAIELQQKYRKLKLADAVIAATAVVNELTLITNNTKDFNNIKGLRVLDPHRIGR